MVVFAEFFTGDINAFDARDGLALTKYNKELVRGSEL